MKYIPYHDHLLVKLIDEEITLKDSCDESPKESTFIQTENQKEYLKLAEVVAVGDHINRKDYYLVFPGDKVLINEYAGSNISSCDGEVYRFVKASDVVALAARGKKSF